ncbi:hypothetical protein L345_09309, partial [Ophiophagus hannah]
MKGSWRNVRAMKWEEQSFSLFTVMLRMRQFGLVQRDEVEKIKSNELSDFVSDTEKSHELFQDEILFLKDVVLQNRLALDLLSVEQGGGVYMYMNQSCCMFHEDFVTQQQKLAKNDSTLSLTWHRRLDHPQEKPDGSRDN